MPARVVLQDFTGVPCVVDLAAMRDAMAPDGGDPDRINPVVPCDLVIDHSVQVDYFGSEQAFQLNVELEIERNVERYQLLKFAQRAFRNFRVVPPGHRDRPPGQPGVPGARGAAPGAVRRAHRLPGHPGRHRLPYHHDQRTRRAGLGRRRDRGRGGDAGAALLHADPRGRGDEAHRRAPVGTTATDLVLTGHRDAPEEGRGGQVRGVLRARALDASAWPTGPPSPTWPRSTGPRWGSSRWTTRRCATWSGPAAAPIVVERVERYCKEQELFRTDATPDPGVQRHARARSLDHRAQPRRAPSGRRTGCRSTSSSGTSW